ncbi:50S ribosomal protein L11 methyltransferase [Geopsychrobacter electrodiphilus]|uniref:50S ribosomal protein L11 methyltransferase n=1 Tax=Geopsychrobacter electrodiphilus TaxID=225196 RepID=UPI0003792526|nr:50S ribosomal protein L11 methyltransferase [Geopsychrobacter electrodiphilus]
MKNDAWILINITIPAPAVDLVCDALSGLGCSGTLVEKRDLDTFTVPDDDFDPNSDLNIQAYFPEDLAQSNLKRQIEQVLDELRPFFTGRHFQVGAQKQVHLEDWAEGWKQHFSTMRIGRNLIIHPSWEAYDPAENEKVLELDPGMAFGTGSHGTTLLCLEGIVDLFDRGESPQSLLDVGTGSGILAMAAAALGADKILACDIDPLACEIATENCRKNQLEARIQITSEPLDQLPGHYNVVVANILAEENIRLADQLVDHLAPGGYLFLSGILQEKEKLVCDGFADQPLELLDVTRQDGWACLTWRRI